MKNLVERIKPYETIIKWIISIICFIWMIFVIYFKFDNNLKIIQKSTLRNTIWNENIPMHDRLESCDSYLELGYNSETKRYCNKLLERID